GLLRRPPRPTPFPYTTLFRSLYHRCHLWIQKAPGTSRHPAPQTYPEIVLRSRHLALVHLLHVFQRHRLVVARVTRLTKGLHALQDRKSTRLNSSHVRNAYAVF